MRACVLCSMIVAKKRLLLCCELYTSVTVASAPTQSKVRTEHRNEACVHNTFLQPHPNNVDDWFVKDFNILCHTCAIKQRSKQPRHCSEVTTQHIAENVVHEDKC